MHGYEVLERQSEEPSPARRAGVWGRFHPDVLTDVIMPGISGWELANRLKAARPL